MKYPSAGNVTALLNLSIINWTIFGISLFTIVYLFTIYRPFAHQETGLKGKLKKIYELMVMTFKSSLPLSKMLEYRMGVCRDYAKLTAALLMSLYPNSKIYLFTFWGHVATGIKMGDRIYILDQRLPLLEPEAWLNIWGVKKAKVFELIKKDDKTAIRYVDEISWRQRRFNTFSIKTMFKEIISEVDKAIKEKRSIVSIALKNAALLFDIDNDVIKESLIRKVRMILQNEFASKASKVRDIALSRNNNDIVLRIHLA